MPADVALHVVSQALLGTLVRLGLLVAVVEDEALHRQRFPVVGKLLQDFFDVLEGLFVLLLLIALEDLLEQVGLCIR